MSGMKFDLNSLEEVLALRCALNIYSTEYNRDYGACDIGWLNNLAEDMLDAMISRLDEQSAKQMGIDWNNDE